MKKYEDVGSYINGHEKWSKELSLIRDTFLESELTEEIKWGAPTYTLKGKNVAGMVGFKEHFAVWFHNGVFLQDPDKKLINAQEGVTKGLRQWRFTDISEIDQKVLKKYITESIQNEKAGKKISPAKNKKVEIPAELTNALKNDSKLQKQFATFTPFKQKEFAEYIGTAKQEKTRITRLEKSIGMILEGIGLNDKYR